MEARNRFVLLSASSLYRVPSIFFRLPGSRVCVGVQQREDSTASCWEQGGGLKRHDSCIIGGLSLPSFSHSYPYIYTFHSWIRDAACVLDFPVCWCTRQGETRAYTGRTLPFRKSVISIEPPLWRFAMLTNTWPRPLSSAVLAVAVAVHARLHIIRGYTGHAPPRSRALSPTRILCFCRERCFLLCLPCRWWTKIPDTSLLASLVTLLYWASRFNQVRTQIGVSTSLD